MPAPHLLPGGAHAGEVVIPLLDDLETGAVRLGDVPARLQPLIIVARVETAKRRKAEAKQRRDEARVAGDARGRAE